MNLEKKSDLPDKSTNGLRDKVGNIPDKLNQAVEEGAGNDVITAFQQMMFGITTAPISVCKILALKVLLLSNAARNRIISRAYKYAFVLSAVPLVQFLFDMEFRHIVAIIVNFVSSFALDRLINRHTDDVFKTTTKKAVVNSKVKSETDNDDVLI